MWRTSIWVMGAALVLCGCQAIWGFKDFKQGSGAAGAAGSGGSGGSGGSANSGGSAGSAGAAPCQDKKAPAGMVGVHVSGGACVWIDRHEVTRGEYLEFLANPPANLPTNCTWDSSLAGPEKRQANAPCVGPGESASGNAGGAAGAAGAGGAAAGGTGGAGAADLPVTCIDYCDALTYCVSQGKALCSGKYNTPKSGQWYDVCSANGANDYPYGATHQSDYCNDSTNTVSGGKLVAVGTEDQCVTSDGVSDLVGNASEWVDECSDASENANCEVRGGSYLDNASAASCTSRVSVQRPYGFAQLGFRCCWSPGSG